MIDPVPVAITAAALAAGLVAMGVSWRGRGARQRDIELPATPPSTGVPVFSADGLYLATTFAGRPLDRVVAGGLGFRAAATVTVTDLGVLLERAGSAPLFLPTAVLDAAGVATWTIDRTVERDGLTVIAWTVDRAGSPAPVESSFRIEPVARAELIAAIRALLGIPRPEADHADH